MADSFADHLRAQLDGIQAELERLATRRRLIEELLGLESASGASAPTAKTRAGRRVQRSATAAERSRLPRGQITNKIREFLGQQREPVHATAILAYLEQHDSAPRSAKPMATLQSNMQRLKEQGEVENTGRNHWRLRAVATAPPAPTAPPSAAPGPSAAAPRPAAGPPAITSTTTFGSRFGAGE